MSNKRRKKTVGTQQNEVAIVQEPAQYKRILNAKSPRQQQLIDSINTNTITFCEGPAGSGKTTISVGMAVEYFRRGVVEKIIITRPIMQADEDLGYLPGTADEKLHPFLLPILDELKHYATKTEVDKWRTEGKIEVVPLALMRGRNFNYSFIILDESQNCTNKQLEMALTRVGKESIMVINGDSRQTDLPRSKSGALNYYMDALYGVDSIGIVYLQKSDVVRNPLISKMLDRIEEYKIDHPWEGRM